MYIFFLKKGGLIFLLVVMINKIVCFVLLHEVHSFVCYVSACHKNPDGAVVES